MHRIVANHLQSFVEEHALDADDQSVKFEKFVNYAVLSQKVSTGFDVEHVTTGDDDDGTDGVAVIINEELALSDSDAQASFATERRNNDVEVVFVQAKTSESFDLGDFLKFKESVLRFFTQNPYSVNSDIQKDARKAFDVAVTNVRKIRHGKPSVSVFYVATGVYTEPAALEAAKNDMRTQLSELGLFKSIDIEFMGRDEIVGAWVATYSGIEASLPMFGNVSLPEICGVVESYLVVAKAKDYVTNLLTSPDGTIRGQLFEENVRHFLGVENPVNSKIGETLQDPNTRSRFPVLNNGITLVSPDVQLQGSTLHIANFQIVNGCQTSHVLFENRNHLSDDLMVTLKVVETKVEDSQFLSLSPVAKRVEAYFNTYDGQENRLYFERRAQQYVGKGIPAIRLVSLHNAAKCVCAMFLKRPDLAFKFPKRMYAEFGNAIFDETNKEIVYYASALTLYRFHLLTSNNTIPANARRLKWHILPVAAALVSGKQIPRMNSRDITKYAQAIIDKFAEHSTEGTAVFARAVQIANEIGTITDDRLKRQAVLDEMLAKIV